MTVDHRYWNKVSLLTYAGAIVWSVIAGSLILAFTWLAHGHVLAFLAIVVIVIPALCWVSNRLVDRVVKEALK